jgi:superoxide dismutase
VDVEKEEENLENCLKFGRFFIEILRSSFESLTEFEELFSNSDSSEFGRTCRLETWIWLILDQPESE